MESPDAPGLPIRVVGMEFEGGAVVQAGNMPAAIVAVGVA